MTRVSSTPYSTRTADPEIKRYEEKIIVALSASFNFMWTEVRWSERLPELLVFNETMKADGYDIYKDRKRFVNEILKPFGVYFHSTDISFGDVISAVRKEDKKFISSL